MTAGHPDHHGPPGGHGDETSKRRGGPRKSVSLWAVLALAIVGIIVYLLLDHRPHVLAALPYVGIVAVISMHLFGHGGHGGRGRMPSKRSDPT